MREIGSARSNARTIVRRPQAATLLSVQTDKPFRLYADRHARVSRDPTQPNLRQVHLLHIELFDELRMAGFEVTAGQMRENITTGGLDLLALPTGTRLHLGKSAVVEVTGLRNPFAQLNGIQPWLMAATLDRDEHGDLVRKAGIMSIVITDGDIEPGDPIAVELPPAPHQRLIPV